MESQYKDGVVENGNGNGNGREEEYEVVANDRKLVGWGLFLRLLAVVLSLAAALVLGLDKQSKTVAMPLVPALPPVNVRVTAEWHYLSAFVYFVVANAIASAYGAISLLLIVASRGEKRKSFAMIFVLDLVMMALLFTSFGAAAAVGLIGFQGNSHVQWRKVCNVFDRFCLQGAAAMLLSGGASLLFLLLVSMAILNLKNKN